MGMRIHSNRHGLDQSQRDRVLLRLECDGDHGLFGPPVQNFEHPDGFIGEHRAAMDAGWLERDGGSRGRLWLCPECSGK